MENADVLQGIYEEDMRKIMREGVCHLDITPKMRELARMVVEHWNSCNLFFAMFVDDCEDGEYMANDPLGRIFLRAIALGYTPKDILKRYETDWNEWEEKAMLLWKILQALAWEVELQEGGDTK